MKEQLLNKLKYIRDSFENEDMSGNRLHNFDAFESSVRLVPADRFRDSNENELTTLLDQAKNLEQEFEHSHPHFSATFKEIVRMLSKFDTPNTASRI